MEVLGEERMPLRSFLQRAGAACENEAVRRELEVAMRRAHSPDLKQLLRHTVVYHYYKQSPAYPKLAWSVTRSLELSEIIALVIERLLTRRRVDPNDSNLLTLGYREVAPGSNGHRVTSTNSVMCYFPNTLISTLRTEVWGELHELIGDDLLVHLLLNYCIFVRVPQPSGSFVQIAGRSLRWLKRPGESDVSTRAPKKRKQAVGVQKYAPHSLDKRTVSINQVMYARHFQKRRILHQTDLSTAGHSGGHITRGHASRVIMAMFPEAAGQKRLPKRLLNLIPIVQEMLQRAHSVNIEAIVARMIPLQAELRDYLRAHQFDDALFSSVNILRNANPLSPSLASANPSRNLSSLMDRVAEDGYLTQTESPISKEIRKRKRLQSAVTTLSNSSAAATSERSTKRVRFDHEPLNREESFLDSSQLSQIQRHREDIATLLRITVPKHRVRRLVRKVLSSILPKSLFGKSPPVEEQATSNWSKLKLFGDRLVLSRKYDNLSIDQAAASFRTKDVEWMNGSGRSTCPPNELRRRQMMMAQILNWVSNNILYPLLRNCFYITECEGSANEVSFYSRQVWSVVSNLALYDLTSFVLRPCSPNETALASHQLGISRLRLLPKVNGIRPLMNLSGKIAGADESVNRTLDIAHRALLFEIERQSNRLLGSTVRNMDEIFMKLSVYLSRVRDCKHCAGEGTKLYCVAVDVERCFDTIRPKKLLKVLKKVFVEDEYLVRKHWVCKGAYYKMERPAFPSGDLREYEKLVNDTGRKRDAVYVDGVLYDYITKSKLLALLKEHLTANQVQANDHVYLQRQGIPQGSVLSTTLCNLYYANFEKRVIRKVLQAGNSQSTSCSHELLMRYTDDFLFISTDLAQAQLFAEVMHRGNNDFGCFVNPTKSRVNFPVMTVGSDGTGIQIPRFDDSNATEECPGAVAWCGVLFEPTSRQSFVNYEKLSLSTIAASIPIDDAAAIGRVFVSKVLSAVRQRWHRLFFDPNSLLLSTAEINLYQMFCLAAVRFVLLAEKLPSWHQPFLLACIRKILVKTSRGILRALHDTRAQLSLMDGGIRRIGLHSFSVVIAGSRTQPRSGQSQRDPISQSRRWERMLALIHKDQDRLQTELARMALPGTSGRTPDLATLERDRHNAVVQRWISALRAHPESRVAIRNRQSRR